MEEIYANAEFFRSDKPIPSSINPTGPRSSRRSFYSGVILSLGLLSVFLIIGLVTTGIYLHDSTASLSVAERLLLVASSNLSSVTEERDHLYDRLTKKTEELKRLQSLFKQSKTCPAGWRRFSCSCYLLSESFGSWDAARKDCRDREADLVVIDSSEEQTFLTTITNEHTWIGLNDKEQEGQWKWVDGTPLIMTYWGERQPDNADGGEDCGHIKNNKKRSWNDLPCSASLKWICETKYHKTAEQFLEDLFINVLQF